MYCGRNTVRLCLSALHSGHGDICLFGGKQCTRNTYLFKRYCLFSKQPQTLSGLLPFIWWTSRELNSLVLLAKERAFPKDKPIFGTPIRFRSVFTGVKAQYPSH